MLEELGISPFTYWCIISIILISTIFNLIISLSITTFVLRMADQIKNFTIPKDYSLVRNSNGVSGLKDVGTIDRNVRRMVITERLDDNGNIVQKEVEPL